MTRILSFAGSNSSASINRRLADHTARRIAAALDGAEHQRIDLNDFEMPLYGIDREKRDGFPPEVDRFLAAVDAADAIVLSLAEHNGAYTVALKNIIDWASRFRRSVWGDTPMLLMATSPGGRGGQSVLGAAARGFPFMGAEVVAQFSLPRFGQHFDDDAGVSAPELAAELDAAVAALLARLVKGPGA